MKHANPLFITKHAHDRYIERFGGLNTVKSKEKRKNTIRKVVAFGMLIRPLDEIRVYLNNNCKDVEYRLYRNIIAVVENGRVVTVYNYRANQWQRVECVSRSIASGSD